MLRSSAFNPNMIKLKLEHFRDGQHSRGVQYVSVHDLYFFSYNFHISRFSRSGTCKGEVNVYRVCPNIVQITVLFCHDPLSHLAIDASS